MLFLFQDTLGFTPQGFLSRQSRYLSKKPCPENQLLKLKLKAFKSADKRLKDKQQEGQNDGVFGKQDFEILKNAEVPIRKKKAIVLVEGDDEVVETANAVKARKRKERKKRRIRKNRFFYTLMKLRTF